jgi:hypothetical protein
MSGSEEKYLRQILNVLNDESVIPRVMAQARFNWILWSIITLTITYTFYYNDRLNVIFGSLLIFTSGLLFGFAMYQGVANKQWQYLKPHLSKDSIEKRISEIKT